MLRRIVSWLALPALVLGLLVVHPEPGWTASGGRIGGGSFRSAPSMPRSYGGGGGYGGSYRGGYGGGLGGGFGFPFVLPFFFGGGGLFGFLVLMAVVGLILNAVRGGGSPAADGGRLAPPRADGPVSVAQVQVGLLARARDLQTDLRRLAGSADTSSSAGLQVVLQETGLALLRHPDLWVYANTEVGQVPFTAAESTFNRLSLAERSKLDRELTSNVAGQRFQDPLRRAGDSDAISDFIAVTVLVATRQRLTLPAASSAEQLRKALQTLSAVPAQDLLAVEVIWQPEGDGESLSTDQLLTAYPDLQHL